MARYFKPYKRRFNRKKYIKKASVAIVKSLITRNTSFTTRYQRGSSTASEAYRLTLLSPDSIGGTSSGQSRIKSINLKILTKSRMRVILFQFKQPTTEDLLSGDPAKDFMFDHVLSGIKATAGPSQVITAPLDPYVGRTVNIISDTFINLNNTSNQSWNYSLKTYKLSKFLTMTNGPEETGSGLDYTGKVFMFYCTLDVPTGTSEIIYSSNCIYSSI